MKLVFAQQYYFPSPNLTLYVKDTTYDSGYPSPICTRTTEEQSVITLNFIICCVSCY